MRCSCLLAVFFDFQPSVSGFADFFIDLSVKTYKIETTPIIETIGSSLFVCESIRMETETPHCKVHSKSFFVVIGPKAKSRVSFHSSG